MTHDAPDLEWGLTGTQHPSDGDFFADLESLAGDKSEAVFVEVADPAGRTSPLAVTLSVESDGAAGKSTTFHMRLSSEETARIITRLLQAEPDVRSGATGNSARKSDSIHKASHRDPAHPNISLTLTYLVVEMGTKAPRRREGLLRLAAH
jgi:hypothetical protein